MDCRYKNCRPVFLAARKAVAGPARLQVATTGKPIFP